MNYYVLEQKSPVIVPEAEAYFQPALVHYRLSQFHMLERAPICISTSQDYDDLAELDFWLVGGHVPLFCHEMADRIMRSSDSDVFLNTVSIACPIDLYEFRLILPREIDVISHRGHILEHRCGRYSIFKATGHTGILVDERLVALANLAGDNAASNLQLTKLAS